MTKTVRPRKKNARGRVRVDAGLKARVGRNIDVAGLAQRIGLSGKMLGHFD